MYTALVLCGAGFLGGVRVGVRLSFVPSLHAVVCKTLIRVSGEGMTVCLPALSLAAAAGPAEGFCECELNKITNWHVVMLPISSALLCGGWLGWYQEMYHQRQAAKSAVEGTVCACGRNERFGV
jgi:hypothetical protein